MSEVVYIKLAKGRQTYRIAGKKFEAAKVYKVDEEFAELLLDKVDDSDRAYFTEARHGEREGAILPGSALKEARTPKAERAEPRAPRTRTADPELEDDSGAEAAAANAAAAEGKPAKPAKKATAKKAAKKTITLSGGKVSKQNDGDDGDEDGENDDSGNAVTV